MNGQSAPRTPVSGNRWGGLRIKIIAWSFVPTAIILLAVALVTFFAFRRVTEELVLQRDLEVTFVSASQLAAQLGEYEDLLTSVARNSDIYQGNPTTQQDALMQAGNRLALFDGGVLFLDAFGIVVAAEPPRPEVLGQDWSDRETYQAVVRDQIARSPARLTLSDIVAYGPGGTDVVVLALPVLGEQNEFSGTLLGMFRVDPEANNSLYADIIRLRIGVNADTYLVDGKGRVIHHSNTARIGEDLSAQKVVQQVLDGQVDAIRTRNLAGNEIVAGFAPVPGTSWGLVTEETWANLVSGYRGYQNFLLVLLVLGVVVPAVVVSVGVRRITKPIGDLIGAAQEVARGNFGQSITAKTGDEIEELGQQFNLMSAQLQESYTNLEQRVANRTKELATLNAISAVVSRSLDLDEILSDALDETLSTLEVEAGSILLIDPGGESVSPRVHRGFSKAFLEAVPRIGLDEGISGQAISHGKPVVVNVRDYPTEHLAPFVMEEGLQTLASAPLLHKGQTLGVLNLATRRPRAFPPQELELLTAIGLQIGVAVENARLYEQSQQELEERARAEKELLSLIEERDRRHRDLVLLNRVIAATTSRLEPRAVLHAVCRELALAFDLPEVGAALLDERGAALTVVAEHRSEERPTAVGTAFPVKGYPSAEYVIQHKEPLAIADAQRDPFMAPIHGLMQERGVASMLILPLIVHEEVVGTIGMVTVKLREFSAEDIALANNAAAAASQALEHARAEEALRASEERLKLAMEGAELGLWDQNLATDERIIIYNWTERLGYTPDELPPTFESWFELVHPDDKIKLAQAWEQYEAGDAPLLEVEHRVRDKSGEWRWILIRGDVVARDEQGKPSRMAGIHQDVTARKRAEEELRRSQQRLALHVLHTPLAYIEWDTDLKVVDWNPAAERIFGYTKQEAQNCHAYEIIVPPEVQPHVAEIWRSLLNQSGGTRSDNENVTKDGRRIICEWYNTPLIDRDGNVIGLASLVQDITQRVRAEEELRQAKEAAEAANRAKSVFLANMSHELRTPLNAILGFAQLMTRDPQLTSTQHGHLDIIERSGEHLLGLINDVLEMSKIEAGRAMLQDESFDLYRMLEGLEEMFQLRAQEKGLTLTFERATDVPRHVRTDAGKLRQVLMNLLGNAVKFTTTGGVTLRVGYDESCQTRPSSVAAERSNHRPCLTFEVEDSGPGIAPEESQALFDPFVQTETGKRSQEGTGLGLPISQQYVQLMGGELTVSSEVGVGSTFAFEMVAEAVDATDIDISQPTRRVVGLEPGQPTYRMLVVDDREDSRTLLVSLLAPFGFEIREAVNGQEALEIWEQWEPHLIWMDLRMPVMDGYEATKRIKSTALGQATVVIALTASAFEQDRALILSKGCDDFVRKPFREEEIFGMLTKHLGVRFVYEGLGDDERDKLDRASPPAGELSREDVGRLPDRWVQQLREAATQLDADVVLELLDQIRDQNPVLTEAMAKLVHNFRFDTIMELTRPQEALDDGQSKP